MTDAAALVVIDMQVGDLDAKQAPAVVDAEELLSNVRSLILSARAADVSMPYEPSPVKVGIVGLGGTHRENANASAEAWFATLRFLREHFQQPDSSAVDKKVDGFN